MTRDKSYQKLYMAAYRLANKDRIAAQSKEYYAANRDACLLREKVRRHLNKDAMNERFTAYRLTRKDEINANNREYMKGYYERNKRTIMLKSRARRKRSKLQKPACVKWSEIEAVYLACPAGMTVDHQVPLVAKRKGVQVASGLHAPWNLQYMPLSENSSKGSDIDYRGAI